MVPGFRYHVTTIAGILVALGVGIILGSQFVQPTVIEQQRKSLAILSQKFDSVVAPLQDQNRRYSQFLDEMAPVVIPGRLANMRIAIVQTGDYPDAVARVKKSLADAGATVGAVCQVDRTFAIKAQTNAGAVRSRYLTSHPSSESDRASALSILANAVARGDTSSDLKLLTDLNMVQVIDGELSRPVDTVLLVGGSTQDYESRAESVDLPLVEELKKTGVKVAYAEPENAGISYIAPLRKAEIPTLDNCDTDTGRIAVVFMLLAPPGDYGSKRTARASFPTSSVAR